jgi:alpha-D-xyloside xylohydrolase
MADNQIVKYLQEVVNMLNMNNKKQLLIYSLFSFSVMFTQAQTIQKEQDEVVFTAPSNTFNIKKIKLKVWKDDIIQVIVSPKESFSDRKSLIITEKINDIPQWNVEETNKEIILRTQSIIARIDKQNYNISFSKSDGTVLLSENEKNLQPAEVAGEKCYHIKQSFKYSENESLYGLGSYMDGEVRLNGKKVIMLQKNREDVVPVIISSNKYGILWDNYSLSEFNDVKGSYYLWSNVADEINYFFLYGDNLDHLVSSYRQLTGIAPMYPKWAYGYIQSKQKYNTQDEIVSIVKEFREKKFPLDLIVQDWQYWPVGQWGQKSFNRKNYPDPKKMMEDIHAMNTKIMISIWPDMAQGGPNNTAMKAIDGLLKDNAHLNILKPEARQLYWNQANDSLFHYGIDGWWADCSEGYDSDWTSPYFKLPPVRGDKVNSDKLTGMFGSGRYINSYALMHTKGLFEGQRATTSAKRVFILTRSAFAGLQKYGASYWTGDVSANWEEFRAQIPAGLNFCMTGIPYWTTDIAGYFIKHEPGWWFSNGVFEKGQEDKGFLELYTRWFQFAAFCPLFRAHGADFPREPWAFVTQDSLTYRTLLKFTNLRYRLIPYLYSIAWRVTNENYTLMRALPFDFMNDSATYNINNQYMFGPSFLVNPVVEPLYYLPNSIKVEGSIQPDANTNTKLEAKSNFYTRSVYLPKGTQWIDFWTGKSYSGGITIKADASFETMPLYVKAGSIMPMGPFIQYSTEKTDPLEIRIYPGANGEFTLYEDENDNYNYEKGVYSLIEFHWNNALKTLTISDRKGEFPGMLNKRKFEIVLVNENSGIGIETQVISKAIDYSGKKMEVNLKF